MNGRFVRVASKGDLGEGKCKLVQIAGEPVALWLVGGRFHAINNVCPHQHHSKLHEGTIEDGKYLTCPMHGWSFCLTDGIARSGGGRAKVYRVKVDGEDVLVESISS